MCKSSSIKVKISHFYSKARFELSRLMAIGKHMFSASILNRELRDSYLKLGHLAAESMERKDLNWETPEAQELSKQIQKMKGNLELIEKEVSELKSKNHNSVQGSHEKGHNP